MISKVISDERKSFVGEDLRAVSNLLKERELEVDILEKRVVQIVFERDNLGVVSEDCLRDYENRVEVLRRDVFRKECEINEYKALISNLPRGIEFGVQTLPMQLEPRCVYTRCTQTVLRPTISACLQTLAPVPIEDRVKELEFENAKLKSLHCVDPRDAIMKEMEKIMLSLRGEIDVLKCGLSTQPAKPIVRRPMSVRAHNATPPAPTHNTTPPVRAHNATPTRLEKEISELKKLREKDKAAIKEAERVLTLVQATEDKYVSVAQENAKLRRDLLALDDEGFWSDLETLQNQHNECISLLVRVCSEDRLSAALKRQVEVAISQAKSFSN